MGKRSNYSKIPKDFYPTIDPKALPPNFLKYLDRKSYAEPCWGEGDLERLITDTGLDTECHFRSDINNCATITKDGLDLTKEDLYDCDLIVTNPPYTKGILLPLIDHWTTLKPTWLLLPADYAHNTYMAPYMKKCSNVVSIGRMYWFENEWVTKEPFDYGDLDKKWDSQVSFYDSMKGIKYYDGYLTNDGKPCKTKFVRGTDNMAWFCFHNTEQQTIFETRG